MLGVEAYLFIKKEIPTRQRSKNSLQRPNVQLVDVGRRINLIYLLPVYLYQDSTLSSAKREINTFFMI
ncbi:hypothetical protein ACLMAB_21030 [Brevibacillus laterosporus]